MLETNSYIWDFIFIYDLFNDTNTSSHNISYLKIIVWLINNEFVEYVRKRSLSHLRHYPSICMEGLSETTKILVKMAVL